MNRIRTAAAFAALAALVIVAAHDLHTVSHAVPDPIATADAQRQQLMFGTNPYAGGSVPLAVRLTPDGRIQQARYVRSNAALPGTITSLVPGTTLTLTAVGNTASYFTGGTVDHSTVAIVTGAPATCTAQLQGSLDNVTFFNVGAALTCTATASQQTTGIPVLFIRYALTAITGGTTPSVAFQYGGA